MHDDARNDPAVLAPATGGSVHGHIVRFYESDAFLIDELTDYVASGLLAGDAALVIATAAHREELDEALHERGLDPYRYREDRRYVALDAAGTLAQFMVDGWPDATRFADVVTRAMARTANGHQPALRAFGEMVGVLWAEGRRGAAVRLEELWNDLAATLAFDLLCAYPLWVFRNEDGAAFERICSLHARALPAESYSALRSPNDRLRAITLLQRQASALGGETAARQTAERVLHRYREEMADFFENAVVPLHTVGPDGVIRQANRAELQLLGYAREEYVGHNIAEFHVDPEVIGDIIHRLRAGETLHDHPARLRCKDGSVKHVLIDSNVRWEDGTFVHSRCITRDVTAQKRAEAERERLLLVAERARADAEAASRAKDEFLSVVSHELRTPLASMLGWVAVLKTGGVTAERASRVLDTIERSGRAQAKLIEDLLDVSRIITGRMRLDLRLVELPAVLRGALDTIRPTADAKGIRIEAWFDPTAGPVAGDADRLQQVAWNLFSNAVKFSPAGGLVEIRLERGDEDVQLIVRDTGRGISAEFLPFVFERFRQEDCAASRRTGGLGLGLAIVRHLVELHGGTVGVTSPGEGKGAEFTVTLPLTPVRMDGLRTEGVPQLLGGIRVLVVDDDADAREAVRLILEAHGATVSLAASVAEARDLLGNTLPDALVSDIRLPDEDGYSLARELRRTARLRPIPAIAVTGHEIEDDGRAVAAGYRVRLAKPVDPELLVAVIGQLTRPNRA